MTKQQESQQQAQQPNQQTTLNVQEILAALNVAQSEANKFTALAGTLTKCAMLLDSLMQQQAQQQGIQPSQDSQDSVNESVPKFPDVKA